MVALSILNYKNIEILDSINRILILIIISTLNYLANPFYSN